jgi:2-keto-4-pentenoate hydratase/2-oxohepta-3-ene-1,7-dioic acid hydratase in catechol pathway
MKLTTLMIGEKEQAAVQVDDGYVPISVLNREFDGSWGATAAELLAEGSLESLQSILQQEKARISRLQAISREHAFPAPLLRAPSSIWGVGANFREKAAEMAVTPHDGEPIAFMKPTTCLIGPGEAIRLPANSDRVTAEAEIGIVIGRTCKGISEADAMHAVAGFVPTLDMTAQDIHGRNPRFLARAKAFDTFFAIGSTMLTPDECPLAEAWTIETALNGETVHRTDVSCMIYSIPFIVSFFAGFMTLHPGDILMSGTPGSVVVRPGDIAECRIAGFEPLRNPVSGA